MYDLGSLMNLLEEYAPISLSDKAVAKGCYDNSGIIIRSRETVEKILYTLDLSDESVKRAKRLGADTIITHHPAVYLPVKKLDHNDPVTAPVLAAAAHGMNVVSMHLNLDMAENGIDMCLCRALGGVEYRIINYIDESHGYGREFRLNDVELGTFAARAAKVLGTKKTLVYGARNKKLKTAATFCGAGGQEAFDAFNKGLTRPDVIVTSDLPHHLIKAFVEKNVCLLILPHYTAEEYGFRKFFEQTSLAYSGMAQAFYWSDKRFK